MIRFEVIDREGWHKEFLVEKTFTYIGSDSRSDLILGPGHGSGVLSPHAQLIVSNQSGDCKLVNLANTDVVMGPSGGEMLKPLSAVTLSEGSVFRLGEFTLVFRGGDTVAAVSPGHSGKNIGLTVSMPSSRLEPHRALEGSIKVSNLGNARGAAQIELELIGLEPSCYDIEPGPILFPHAEKEVFFHIYHRGSKPLAGENQVTIRATAPKVYPDEEITVTRTIKVAPVYLHQVSWAAQPAQASVPPLPAPDTKRRAKPEAPATTGIIPTAQALPVTPVAPVMEIAPSAPVTPAAPALPAAPAEEAAPMLAEEYVSPPTIRRIRAPRQSKDEKLPEETPPGGEGKWSPRLAATGQVSPEPVQPAPIPAPEPAPENIPAPAPPADDWLPAPAVQEPERPVLRLKAKAPPSNEQSSAPTQAIDDWWKPG
jgi:hypothetical protein